jgi:hypothetical protein
MSNTQSSSVTLGGTSLRPAPYVSTAYEYERSGSYIIGGTLNVSLNGTIVSEDILNQINSINQLSANNSCLNLTVGCAGSPTFLSGSGRVIDISISTSDNAPFTANYTIVVSLDTVDGQPAVLPDSEFIEKYGLPSNTKFLKSYSEQIDIDGDATVIGSVDNQLGVSTSFIKASGQLSVACGTAELCGIPGFNGIDQSINIIKKRFAELIQFNLNSDHILSEYNGWTKWLDSKSFTIDEDGTVSCSFDLYMTKGGCQPIARININTEDRIDNHKITTIPNRSINASIVGLSAATTDLLSNKSSGNERLANAISAWSTLEGLIKSGAWPGDVNTISGTEGLCLSSSCPPSNNYCYQRLSSNINISKVSGEISVNAEFGPIDSCANNDALIETTIEEELPVARYKEFIVPNNNGAVVQYFGETPYRATITSRGSLKSCDLTKKADLISCVTEAFNKAESNFGAFIRTSYNVKDGTFSYTITATYVKCDV